MGVAIYVGVVLDEFVPLRRSVAAPPGPSPLPSLEIPEFARRERVDVLDYDLPHERIALHPVSPRSASRMLVARKQQHHQQAAASLLSLRDGAFRDIVRELPRDTLIVVNDTKVVAARLFLQRERRSSDGSASFSKCEVLCVSPEPEPSLPSQGPMRRACCPLAPP